MDDQNKFINAYINNLAEKLKAMTLDTVMLNTQLNIAKEKVAELEQKNHILEHEAEQRIETIKTLMDRNGGSDEFDTSDGYSTPAQEEKASLSL